MTMAISEDDLLQVSGGFSGMSAAQIKQEVVQYLQNKGLDTGSESERELKTLIYSLKEEGRSLLYDYLINKNIDYAEFPTWLQDCFVLSNGYETEQLLNSITGPGTGN